jgi:hypothetical protein
VPAVVSVLLVIGAFNVWTGVSFWRGGARRIGAWYTNPRLPFFVRNAVFALIPLGVGPLLILAALALGSIGETWGGILSVLLVIPVGVCTVLALVFVVRPPTFLKPKWIRQADAQRSRSGDWGNS